MQIGSLSAEWLAEERTKVVGTFPPKKKGWTGYVEKDTAGQTNIYSVEVTNCKFCVTSSISLFHAITLSK